jgi:hypothetical protein
MLVKVPIWLREVSPHSYLTAVDILSIFKEIYKNKSAFELAIDKGLFPKAERRCRGSSTRAKRLWSVATVIMVIKKVETKNGKEVLPIMPTNETNGEDEVGSI